MKTKKNKGKIKKYKDKEKKRSNSKERKLKTIERIKKDHKDRNSYEKVKSIGSLKNHAKKGSPKIIRGG